jgi:hypothetical protein
MKMEGLKYGNYPNRFFVGEVIRDEIDRQFIIDEILKVEKNKKIVKTKLIYSFHSMALLNPHAHIIGVPHYVMIVTL